MSDFEQGIRIFAIFLGAILLIIGLSNLFSRPVIDMEDPEGTANSIINWFFDVGGGLLSSIFGFALIVLGINPRALSLLLEGRLR